MLNWIKDGFEITLNVMSTVQSVLFELSFLYKKNVNDYNLKVEL